MTASTKDVLDEYLARQNTPREPDGKFHPSSLWMCDRQAVMTARGEAVTNAPTERALRVFELGNTLHLLIQSALKAKYGDRFSPEFEIAMEWIAGHGDGLLMDTSDEGDVVYEFKSTRSLYKVRKEKRASPHHLQQGATYAVALHKLGVKIKELRVVYFEKSGMDIQEYIYPWQDSWESEVDNKVAALLPYLDEAMKDQYPACTGPKWLHAYCPFFPACEQAKPGGNTKFSW